MNMTL